MKSGWLNKLEHNTAAAPTPEQLRGLALALDLPLRLLQEAAAAQFLGMGEVWSGDHRVRVLVARIEEMSPEDVEQLTQIADTFSRNRGPAKPSE
ncbi:hypothetical protein [Streptomyces sp. NPDC023838]|uniref:hypothetical protein n=1 Tax=Streptomyces sp. NPDC023838 TaxID=3154325 RepID=UPI0033C7A5EF